MGDWQLNLFFYWDCLLCIIIYLMDTDLQMAATFGKMLLEKNEQLQHELQHLQKVAEETSLENQVCIIMYTQVCE